MRFIGIATVSLRLALVGSLIALAGSEVAVAASAEAGKQAYVKNGCWQCHGFEGQGTITSNGRVLARTEIPVDGFISFVHSTNGPMPPYRSQVLSDSDLADIYAYLQSLPKPKAPSDIPLLNAARQQ